MGREQEKDRVEEPVKSINSSVGTFLVITPLLLHECECVCVCVFQVYSKILYA